MSNNFINNVAPTASRATFAWTAVLTILLAAFAFATLLTHSKSETIKNNVQVLQLEKDNYLKIDTCIAILYAAENNSRFFVVTQDSAYISAYNKQLQAVVWILGRYQAEREYSNQSLSRLVFEKRLKDQEFIKLRLMVDSLLAFSLNNFDVRVSHSVRPVQKVHAGVKTQRLDSTILPEKRHKRKLVKRLIDAIRDADSVDNHVLKTRNTTILDQDSVKVYLEPLSIQGPVSIQKARRDLSLAEQRLLSINSVLFANLKDALQELKNQEQLEIKILRTALLASTKAKSEEMSMLMWTSVALVFMLSVVIIFNLAKLYKKDATILAFADVTAKASARKGEFLAQVTHEFRTPLNSIIGFSNLIDTEKLAHDQQISFASIKTASQMMLMLVNEILDFSKFESANIILLKEPFRPVDLIDEAVSMLSVLANEKRISLLKQLDPSGTVTLIGDNFRIKQIVVNLISNAIKFTPEHGTITVKLRMENQNKDKGTLVFSIKDSGVGIAKEHLGSIFENFTQIYNGDSKARQAGTGLGLAICKRIVDLYGGQIKVESTLGQGSDFTVRIPLVVSKSASIVPQNSEPKIDATALLKDKKLLIADDTKMNLLLISRIIDKLGASYDLAENGQVAFEMFKANTYDLIITDIAMPIMDGIELTKLIREYYVSEKARIPVIGFTGYIDEDNLGQFRAAGMNEILPKPFDENHFIALSGRLLRLA
ncbi:hybrid sensor histidine kinase/response regulator [Dyadobacter psychrophilus]|uniref:histidine kinase n=1 Tax=Dyadobacter psychrophilus TaxID=651661 RepID=A0A1T5HJW2_9BACT|nr:ATP-binding protein [Dyadobacter psychrophilus]SKC20926.1 His Kinase A (phospho-acceptor) domain-containing protein [Dyadobacter psychrophilus]